MKNDTSKVVDEQVDQSSDEHEGVLPTEIAKNITVKVKTRLKAGCDNEPTARMN